ncbi:MAG TPA: endonuclease MutS2 [Bacillota bacterium]|nr:endonuclease MutS2 [Bacillota bacterium]
MNNRTLHALEYNKIIDKLKAEAATTLGIEQIENLTPQTDLATVETMQQETDEVMHILRLNQTIPLGGIVDIRSSVKRSTIGGMLSIEQCLNVASTIYGTRQAKNFIKQSELNVPHLQNYAATITSLRELEQEIKRCIDDEGKIVDRATPTLRSIRSKIQSLENKVRDELNRYTRTKSKYLSEAIVTIRNDRYVLPVKADQQHMVGGIVHDQSASGQTVFMEPRTVVTLNNELQHLAVLEKQEIDKILQRLSEQIATHHLELMQNIETIARIDFIHARALYSEKINGARPTLNDKGIIDIKDARHPLIPHDEVVANDINIGEDYTAIVITGPNTGGKTVTLKLIGLITLMAQSGIQVPALDGCRLAVFERVFADIGDEQSIEQNLSTFSSHMTNIVSILQQVNENTLVLFDELGAGTDPQEGAALAMSILDETVGRKARVVATTHYPELKVYGYNRKNVINASVEFNVDTLEPTYRLLIGVPGRSNAFEISKRLGLDERVIKRASEQIGHDTKSVESMIGSLEQSTRKADEAYEQAANILTESEQLLTDLKREWQHFLNRREQLYEAAERKAERELTKARQRAEQIVEQFREKQLQSFKEHEWIEARHQLEEAELTLTKKHQAPETLEMKKEPIKPGDDVKLLSVNQRGSVIEQLNDDEFVVQVGIMKVNVKRKDLQRIDDTKQTEQTPIPTVRSTSRHTSTELDLRGERYDEALNRLEKYIDSALLAGYSRVSIIHGKGTGALRKGVQQFAQSHPNIASYRDGKANEGGTGVTIIELQ